MKIKNKSKLAGLLIVAFTVAFVGCHKKNKNKGNMMGQADTTNMAMSQTMGAGQMANANNSDFMAKLTGENETHQVQTDASGMAYFMVNNDTSKIMYTLKLMNADSVTMAHIHYGVSGQTGPIVVWLYPGPDNPMPSLKKGPINGVLKEGTITSSDLSGPMKGATIKDLVWAMMHDSTYVNVHNKQYPHGFLRGEVQGTGMNGNSNM